MTREQLKQKVTEIMEGENRDDAYVRLCETIFSAIESYGEPFGPAGHQILRAYLDDNLNEGFILAMTGWSFESMLVKAGLLPDIEGAFGEAVPIGSLSPFEKASLAKTIACDIVQEGTTNTTSGNWIVYFDEIQEKFKVDLSEDKEMLDAVAEELHNSYEEKIAEVSVSDNSIDVTYYLDFCPNAE